MQPEFALESTRPTGIRPRVAARRVMFYSHDTYGLGHIRRTLCIVRALLEEEPEVKVLLATGSPVIGHLSVPASVQVVPLRPVIKVGADAYEARDGGLDRRRVLAYRSAQLFAAVRFFRPNVLVVDHQPLGMKGELTRALQFLRRSHPQTRIVLGLRDILDEAEVVQRVWREQGVYEALDRYYDKVLVYGEERHFSIGRQYGLSESLQQRLEYTGYIRKNEPILPAEQIRDQLGVPSTAPLLLATVGGGGDGSDVLEATVAAVPLLRKTHPGLVAVVVTGPLMENDRQRALATAASGVPGVRLMSFIPNLTSVMATADVVVAMAGYNTVTEVLALGRGAVFVPRVTPRKEQYLRASILAGHGLVRMLLPSELSPARLSEEVSLSLKANAPRVADLVDLKGREKTVSILRTLLHEQAPSTLSAAGS